MDSKVSNGRRSVFKGNAAMRATRNGSTSVERLPSPAANSPKGKKAGKVQSAASSIAKKKMALNHQPAFEEDSYDAQKAFKKRGVSNQRASKRQPSLSSQDCALSPSGASTRSPPPTSDRRSTRKITVQEDASKSSASSKEARQAAERKGRDGSKSRKEESKQQFPRVPSGWALKRQISQGVSTPRTRGSSGQRNCGDDKTEANKRAKAEHEPKPAANKRSRKIEGTNNQEVSKRTRETSRKAQDAPAKRRRTNRA
ncbi:hypothetical protein cyc_06541 [Cyclospora cayetanensis]|uniref:Uncharacterized protein n=1 Tax=Cyclospora cayetanensis TaxID=88456 RepID=A0A1D3D4E7_9EIME|nr:hypothetical protein cyc_06541 [Cyclospora cayetanensis]